MYTQYAPGFVFGTSNSKFGVNPGLKSGKSGIGNSGKSSTFFGAS